MLHTIKKLKKHVLSTFKLLNTTHFFTLSTGFSRKKNLTLTFACYTKTNNDNDQHQKSNSLQLKLIGGIIGLLIE